LGKIEMAMNKAEKAQMEHLQTALALCWPAYPCPQPMSVEEIKAAQIEGLVERHGHKRSAAIGWFVNAYNSEVSQGLSDGHIHDRSGNKSWSQGAGTMYRTKQEALMAMRHEASRDFAAKLARIDARLATAVQTEGMENG
jgi:hypothetical protein